MKVDIRQVEADDAVLGDLVGHKILKESSHIWIGLADDHLVVIWGTIPQSFLSDKAHLWADVKPVVMQYRIAFLRLSRLAVVAALEEYPTLYGICTGNHKWLEWLGAKFGPSVYDFPSFTIEAFNG